jgi:CBS domain-containing protein
MTASLLTVSADATLGEAAAAMAARGVGAVVVLQGESVAAILTERDVMKAVAAGKDGSAPVEEWMTAHPDTIEPGDTTDHAASLMIHGGFRHLPVVEADGRVVGIVSIRDLMKVALDDRSPRGV